MRADEFGGRGSRPSQLELQLLQTLDRNDPWGMLAARLSESLGSPQAACTALCVLFDEFGGEKPAIPTRPNFFRRIHRRIRDEEIIVRIARGDSLAEIGYEFGLSTGRVSQIALAFGTTAKSGT